MYKCKLIAIFILLMCIFQLQAGVYGIKDIPNVQLQDSTRLLSNPDGIISPEIASQIDQLLLDARRRSSTEIAVVVVDNIDTDDIDTFATRLGNEWGIGKKDKNNGILVLVAKDGHAATIRTGYGSEGVLPDILAGRIIDETMIPYFRTGDYDNGVLEGVRRINQLVTDPKAVSELMSQLKPEYGHKTGDGDNLLHAYLWTGVIVAVVMLLWLLISYLKLSKGDKQTSDYKKYHELEKLNIPFWICTLLFIGIPVIALVLLWLARKRLRNHARNCPRCGNAMQKLNEEDDNNYLNQLQDLEERIKSVDYDVWLCPHCNEKDIYSFVNRTSQYRECPACHGRTMRLNSARILKEPTYTTEGQGEKIYNCLYCQNNKSEKYSIPRKERPVVVASGRSISGRSFGGGGFGGGGFGGGRFGGGGATGRW